MPDRGHILLAGGAEFGGRMADADRQALLLAGGSAAPVSIIPAAAAPDQNHRRAGENGRRWFASLGASQVSVLPLIDRRSAEDPAIAEILRQSRLVYLLGGFTHYLAQTLLGSLAWQSILQAFQAGAVIAGSSAGAMVLCSHYYDPESSKVQPGLGLVPNSLVLPHHNTFGRRWAAPLQALLPSLTLLGLDEYTAVIASSPSPSWTVYGLGLATRYRLDQVNSFSSGVTFTL